MKDFLFKEYSYLEQVCAASAQASCRAACHASGHTLHVCTTLHWCVGVDMLHRGCFTVQHAGVKRRTSLLISKECCCCVQKGPGWLKQTATLMHRNLLNNTRELGIFWVRLVMYAMLCICLGFVFFQLDQSWCVHAYITPVHRRAHMCSLIHASMHRPWVHMIRVVVVDAQRCVLLTGCHLLCLSVYPPKLSCKIAKFSVHQTMFNDRSLHKNKFSSFIHSKCMKVPVVNK